MKRIISVLLSLVVLMANFSFVVSASSELKVSMNNTTRVITIEITGATTSVDKPVVVTIFKPGKSFDDLNENDTTSIKHVVEYMAMETINQVGKATLSYQLRDSAKTSDYVVVAHITDDDKVYTKEVYYANPNDTIEALASLNDAKTAANPVAALRQSLETYKKEINIIDSLGWFNNECNNQTPILESLVGATYSNIEDFKLAFEQLVVLEMIRSASAATLFSTLEKTTFYTGIGIEYKEFVTNADIVLFKTILEKTSFTTIAEFKAKYFNSVALNKVNVADWKEIAGILTTYNNYFNLPLNDDITQISDTSAVYREISQTDVTTNKELLDLFNQAVARAKASQSGSKSPSPSYSGGGGGGNKPAPSSILMLPSPEKIEIFNDIGDFSWAKESIEALAQKGIISANEGGRFNPERNITREEFIKMMVLALGLSVTNKIEVGFSDMDKDDWFAPYVQAAFTAGLVKGDGNKIGAGVNISRQDITVIIARGAEKLFEHENSQTISFVDNGDIDEYAKDAVAKAQKIGIINGMADGRFAPKDSATRAQAAKMIYSLYKLLAEQ